MPDTTTILKQNALVFYARKNYETLALERIEKCDKYVFNENPLLRGNVLGRATDWVVTHLNGFAVNQFLLEGSFQWLSDSLALVHAILLWHRDSDWVDSNVNVFTERHLVQLWYLSLFLGRTELEALLFRHIIDREQKGRLYVENRSELFHEFLENMIHSRKSGVLTFRTRFGNKYSPYFTNEYESLSLQSLYDSYCKRAAGPSRPKNSDMDEPAGYLPYTVFPAEILGYLSLVENLTGNSINVSGISELNSYISANKAFSSIDEKASMHIIFRLGEILKRNLLEEIL
ncbi:hypothetical protein [Reinekea sp. G2M2-21]|uniref:hypothetical protein n=1 Tax=Reinekea sp. G2M2-21 TaxID=2788942 RepID=UPI0018ABF408|nr:hypothetical protein [Reinekea sp. G2M2-21]